VDMREIFGKDGLISQKLPAYEERPEQIEMATAVQSAIREGKHLIVEAGTGTGKSLAYLAPFILWSVEEKKRVIVSTNTKTLQHQLLDKDIPLLQERLPVKFNACLALGSRNYLCLRRLNQNLSGELLLNPIDQGELTRVLKWEKGTRTGIRSELERKRKIGIWERICREPDLCMGKNCPHQEKCYYERARKRLFGANIIVVNHHLFFANLATNGMLLPRYQAVVFDEAHSLEEVATSYFGVRLTNSQLNYLLNSIHNPRTGAGLANRLGKVREDKRERIQTITEEAREAADTFYGEILHRFGPEPKTIRVKGKNPFTNRLREPLRRLYSALKNIEKGIDNKEKAVEVSALADRCREFSQGIDAFLTQSLVGYVYWIDIEPKRRRNLVAINMAPINIAAELKKRVLDQVHPILFTSATLAIDHQFDFLKQRLGLNECQELILSSSFNYRSQVQVYIPTDGPDPRLNPRAYTEFVAAETERILEITQGRAFVLFTSYGMMREVHSLLKDRFPRATLLKQGDASREELLAQFKEEVNSTLCGVATFWQGVDVPGEALQCVILTKLPFDLPNDPVMEARIESLREKGANPFLDYQLPQAIMTFKQGFGRLIRHKNDYGLVAILDTRVRRKSYGARFLNSLPQCKITISLNDVRQFFKNIPRGSKLGRTKASRNRP